MALSDNYTGGAPTLYHGRRKRLEIGDVLPTNRQQAMDGSVGDFVFATDRYTEALVYAAITQRAIFNMQMKNPFTGGVLDVQLLAVQDGQTRLDEIETDFTGGNIVEVNPQNFRQVLHRKMDGEHVYTGEWVSEEPAEVTAVTKRFDSLEDIMKSGLLIFTVDYGLIKPNYRMDVIRQAHAEKGMAIEVEHGFIYSSTAQERLQGRRDLVKDPRNLRDLVQTMSSNPENVRELHARGLIKLLNHQIDDTYGFVVPPRAP